MQKKILDLNDGNYKYSLSIISDSEWQDMAHTIVLTKGEYVKLLELLSFKVTIRENQAKFKICFQDSSYHEHEYHLDEFGRSSKQYRDCVSALLQEVMAKHFGNEYLAELSEKLDVGISQ